MILYNNTIRKQLKFLFYNKCLKLLTCLVNYEKNRCVLLCFKVLLSPNVAVSSLKGLRLQSMQFTSICCFVLFLNSVRNVRMNR